MKLTHYYPPGQKTKSDLVRQDRRPFFPSEFFTEKYAHAHAYILILFILFIYYLGIAGNDVFKPFVSILR